MFFSRVENNRICQANLYGVAWTSSFFQEIIAFYELARFHKKEPVYKIFYSQKGSQEYHFGEKGGTLYL